MEMLVVMVMIMMIIMMVTMRVMMMMMMVIQANKACIYLFQILSYITKVKC